MAEALEIAIRAEESAKAAHHRLDRMNGSIEKLNTTVSSAKEEILRRLDKQDGIDEGTHTTRKSFLDSQWRVLTLAAGFVGSGAFAALFTYFVRRHG